MSLKATKEKLTRTAKLSEEDSTDVDVGASDSLAVISYRDINVFTYVNTPDAVSRLLPKLGSGDRLSPTAALNAE
jgi:hypothetical protein